MNDPYQHPIHPETGFLYEPCPRIPESLVTEIWLREARPGRTFRTLDGEEFVLVTTGHPNRMDGPDFLNGTIVHAGETLTGAIEIHRTEKEWDRHGHNRDRRYARILLHVILFGGDSIGAAGTGSRFTICLADQLTQPLRTALQHAREERDSRQTAPLPPEVCSSVSLRTRTAMILISAAERFRRKTDRIARRSGELRALEPHPIAAESELLFELVADAFGYPRNRTQMRSVARSLPLRFWQTSGIDDAWNRAVVVLGATGVLDAFSSRLDPGTAHDARERWMRLRSRVPGVVRLAWNNGGARPNNAPWNRLLMLAGLIPSFIDGTLMRKLRAACLLIGRDPAACRLRFENIFRLGGGTLSGHLRIPSVGRERIHELVVNIVAPFLAWHGHSNGSDDLVRSAECLYFRFPSTARNSVTGRMEIQLSIISTGHAGIQQGMIEISERFCSGNRCAECLIGIEIRGR